ncbi:uncharacterized protein PRCAT00006316001 [Priceomyces carsonii]|uniref:uncharacterized protein n=1 Tax=Priceomyces carsonii TaxID=28549 RepID=UPI002EDA2CAF|nr:unnamed protein product [Priceomyces carsonii]
MVNFNYLSSPINPMNLYMEQLPEFMFEKNYVEEIKDEEVCDTVNQIIYRMDATLLGYILGDYAFRDHKVISPTKPQENILTLKEYLIEPSCSALIPVGLSLNVGVQLPDVWCPAKHEMDYDVRTDLVVCKEDNVYCAIETQAFPMLLQLKDKSLKDIGKVIFKEKKITEYMTQLICKMLYFKTNKGILTDCYTFIFVEIDLDSFESSVHTFKERNYNRNPKTIPIRYKVLNCHSALPSLREALLYFIHNSVEDDSRMKIRKERVGRLEAHLKLSGREVTKGILNNKSFEPSKSSISRSSMNGGIPNKVVQEKDEEIEDGIIDVPKNHGSIYVQNGHSFNTQLVKLKSRYFKKFLLQDSDDNETLVAKIYDPRMAKRVGSGYIYTDKEIREKCDHWYSREKEFYQILSKDVEFNSLFVNQKVLGQVMVTIDKLYIAKGYFNLFKYVESVPLPNNIETYKKVKKQLDVIHHNGIIHGNIRRRNILYTKDDKIYIIDFATSKYSGEERYALRKEDLKDLRLLFYDCISLNK